VAWVLERMITRTALRLFLFCLVLCASMFVTFIWLGEDSVPPVYFQILMTLFAVGLASFLIWFSLTLRSIYTLLQEFRTIRPD